MPIRYINSRLAAHADTRQVEVSLRADAAANAVDRKIAGYWTTFLWAIREPMSWMMARHHFRQLFAQLMPDVAETTRDHLSSITRWAGNHAGETLKKTLPLPYLRAAALDKATRPLREDTSTGLLQLAITPTGLQATDFTEPLREPAVDSLSEDEQRRIYAELLFPPPSEAKVNDILSLMLQGTNWYQALDGAALAAEFSPEKLAQTIAMGYAKGDGQHAIANAALPFVDGVRYRAARVARTWGLAVAQQSQMEMHAEIGELLDGYQVRATLDQHTRPLHRARHGTVYYVNPEPGQLGLGDMPHPPIEADGELAWNCRCILTVVLKPPSNAVQLQQHPAFSNASGQVIPDPLVYSDWWTSAGEKEKRIAVGSRRYSAAQKVLGHAPSWDHMVNPDTGELLPVSVIRGETQTERTDRMTRLRAVAHERRALIQHISTMGFLPPSVAAGVMRA